MAALTRLRDRYFPKERNYLQAHVTMFHKLPGELMERWLQDLSELTNLNSKFSMTLNEAYFLGRGFAVRVESPELHQLREKFANKWRDFLSPQDQQTYKAHCTFQNKVDPEKARGDLQHFLQEWSPRTTEVRALQVWEYLGGPWKLHREFPLSQK